MDDTTGIHPAVGVSDPRMHHGPVAFLETCVVHDGRVRKFKRKLSFVLRDENWAEQVGLYNEQKPTPITAVFSDRRPHVPTTLEANHVAVMSATLSTMICASELRRQYRVQHPTYPHPLPPVLWHRWTAWWTFGLNFCIFDAFWRPSANIWQPFGLFFLMDIGIIWAPV